MFRTLMSYFLSKHTQQRQDTPAKHRAAQPPQRKHERAKHSKWNQGEQQTQLWRSHAGPGSLGAEVTIPRCCQRKRLHAWSGSVSDDCLAPGVALGLSWRRIQKRLKAKFHCFIGSSDAISRHARFKDAQVWRAEPDWLSRRRGLRQVRLGHEPVRGEFLDWLKGR